jgi:hypothetical protein
MAARAVSSARDPQHDVRWKWLLLALCALAATLLAFMLGNWFGIGGRPWFGLANSQVAMTEDPYVEKFGDVLSGGASEKAALHDGDLLDLREQTIDGRVRMIFNVLATRPTILRVHRGARVLTIHLVGGTLLEAGPGQVFSTMTQVPAEICFLICATLIAARRWWLAEARTLAFVMLFEVAGLLVTPGNIVVPGAILQLLLCALSGVLLLIPPVLLVILSSRYGSRSSWRGWLTSFAIVANIALQVVLLIGVANTVTLWIDPVPYYILTGYFAGSGTALGVVFAGLPFVAVVSCALAAILTSPVEERPRTAWLLMPLSIVLCVVNVVLDLIVLAPTLFWATTFNAVGGICWVVGGIFVTYALLNRRVLDIGFVLGRTLAVSIVGFIVVIAFVLLEWSLGTVLVGVSHVTGLLANAGLALVLGLSMNAIHKRVDAAVDTILFRKRHDDERALLDFSKEAAYVTKSGPLLDEAIAKVRCHTDARSAGILLDGNGTFAPARSFGSDVDSIDENDGAILALKTWHKPIDPHHYETDIKGALAVPMVARGQLLGLLLLGERTGGEAYAPDEVEALSQLAHGVASALDGLSLRQDGAPGQFQEVLNQLRIMSDTLALALERNATNYEPRLKS